MADNEINEEFLEKLEKLSEEFEVANKNKECSDDDLTLSNLELHDHYSEFHSSQEIGRSLPASSFPREIEVASSVSILLNTQCLGNRLDTSTSGADQRFSEASEENAVSSFIVPEETSESELSRQDDNELKPNEHLLPLMSTSPKCRETDGIKSKLQITEECKIFERIFPKVFRSDDTSTMEMATNSASLRTNAVAEALSEAGPSVIHPQSHKSKKERLFVCDVCGKAFSHKGNLHKHSMTHTGETPFVCETCSKGFTQKWNLTRHLQIHAGEKPFECDICNKRFTRKADLTRHAWTHTGEKPFACKICGKAFSNKTSPDHLRTHTGEKPFKCPWCGKGYLQKSHCTRHEKEKHG